MSVGSGSRGVRALPKGEPQGRMGSQRICPGSFEEANAVAFLRHMHRVLRRGKAAGGLRRPSLACGDAAYLLFEAAAATHLPNALLLVP
jgi:hypothetical protein